MSWETTEDLVLIHLVVSDCDAINELRTMCPMGILYEKYMSDCCLRSVFSKDVISIFSECVGSCNHTLFLYTFGTLMY